MASFGKLFAAFVAAFLFMAAGATAQEVKHYRFAYDQPKTTGYGILGDIFADKLKELSKGTMLIDQYPGAQLGQEPQVLQLVKSGDVEFCISSSANAATISPQAGVMSMHFLFRSEAHLIKAIADPEVSKAVKAMIAETVQGAHVIGLATLGLRHMYAKREIRKIEDIKGLKVRVQATPTEDTMFPADEVNRTQPAKALELEHQSTEKLKSIGVKVVTDVDKSGFTAIADPYLDKLAKGLGPHAEKIKNLIRAIN